MQRRAPDFEKLTGAKVQVITVPFSDLYNKLLTDFATGTNSYDAGVFAPQWMGDFIEPGYLEVLTERVNADAALKWDDIAPFFRDFSASYKGDIYTIPLDGDFQMAYYRTDLLKEAGLEPPKTWDDYLAIAEQLQRQGPERRRQCRLRLVHLQEAQRPGLLVHPPRSPAISSRARAPRQGAFFDAETMTPLIDNEGFRKALQIYIDSTKYGPPDEINLDVGDTRGLFTSGRCALTLDWGDIGTLAIDPKTSKVADKVGAVIIPGSQAGDRPRHRQAGRLRRHHLPLRDRRRQPRPVRGLRRLVGRHQRRQGPEDQGRGLRLPLLHGAARAGQCGRHHRRHRLQPLPDLAVREHSICGSRPA